MVCRITCKRLTATHAGTKFLVLNAIDKEDVEFTIMGWSDKAVKYAEKFEVSYITMCTSTPIVFFISFNS